MKTIIAALLLIICLPAAADHMVDMDVAVILHECDQINPETDHFTCQFDKKYNRIDIEWQISEDALTKLPAEERRTAWYNYSRLALHVAQYGHSYILGWPGTPRSQLCRQWQGVSYISVGCIPFKGK